MPLIVREKYKDSVFHFDGNEITGKDLSPQQIQDLATLYNKPNAAPIGLAQRFFVNAPPTPTATPVAPPAPSKQG